MQAVAMCDFPKAVFPAQDAENSRHNNLRSSTKDNLQQLETN